MEDLYTKNSVRECGSVGRVTALHDPLGSTQILHKTEHRTHIHNPITLEVKAGGSRINGQKQRVQGQPELHETLYKEKDQESRAHIDNSNHLLWLMFMVHLEFGGRCQAGAPVELFAQWGNLNFGLYRHAGDLFAQVTDEEVESEGVRDPR